MKLESDNLNIKNNNEENDSAFPSEKELKNIITEQEEKNKVPENFKHLSYSQYQKLPECDRCHCKTTSDSRHINITYLTATAPWHRKASLETVHLCRQCC